MAGGGSILFGYGEEAVLDTCEANYSKTIYIAEFFNAISSLPVIFLGFYGYSKLHYAESDWLLSCTFLLLCLVGVGSFISHTYLYSGFIIFEELPLFYCFFCFVQCIFFSFPEDPTRTHFSLYKTIELCQGCSFTYLHLLLYLSLFISQICFIFPSTVLIYQTTYSCYILTAIWWSIQACDAGNIQVRELYLRFALTCFIGCVFWCLEQVLCEETGYLGFHFMWHIFISYALYIWMIFVIAFRGQKKKDKLTEITWHFKDLIPTIIYLDNSRKE